MKQILKYSYPGKDVRMYDIVSCTDDGKWHLIVHGTDRLLEYDCELCENEYGQYLKYGKGSILPLTNRKGELFDRWSEASEEDVTFNDGQQTTDNGQQTKNVQEFKSSRVQEPQTTKRPTPQTTKQDNLLRNSITVSGERIAEPKRPILKTLGLMAVMTMVLVVVWESGLVIPLGILGLITSGLLK